VAERVVFLQGQELCWQGTVKEMRQSDDKRLLDFITASEFKIKM
jgi:phospholipid/cholesterol/gamma-HCH transport system ATP-binding protein